MISSIAQDFWATIAENSFQFRGNFSRDFQLSPSAKTQKPGQGAWAELHRSSRQQDSPGNDEGDDEGGDEGGDEGDGEGGDGDEGCEGDDGDCSGPPKNKTHLVMTIRYYYKY